MHGALSIGMTHMGAFGSGEAIWYDSGSEVPESFYGETPPTDSWMRIEHYIRLSRPAGMPNGERYSKLSFSGDMTFSGYPGGHYADPAGTGIGPDEYRGAPMVTRTIEHASLRIQNLLMPFFTRPEQRIQVWIDEVYVDTTPMRVELGDRPRWSDCTERAPQPATEWSDTSITVEINRGRLSGTAYAFVVSADGSIQELGAIGTWSD